MLSLYLIALEHEQLPNNYCDLLELISVGKKAQIAKYISIMDKKKSLLSDLFVRSMACSQLNVSNRDLSFVKNRFGKPYLTSKTGFYFNSAYTDSAIVVGFSDQEIGVDVEIIKNCNLNMANRFFSTSEWDHITSDALKTNSRFYEIWTKKEAYLKWRGTGINVPLSSFSTMDMGTQINSIFFGEYVVSICSELNLVYDDCVKSNYSITLNQLSERQLLENILNNRFLMSPQLST